MKKIIGQSIYTLLLVFITALLLILNSVSTSFSLDLLYIMLGISVAFSVLSIVQKAKGPSYMVLIVHLLMFMYLAFALLAIGSSLDRGFMQLVLYILVLLLDWIGLGYSAFQLKRLMKL